MEHQHYPLSLLSNKSHYFDKFVTIRYRPHVALIADAIYTALGSSRVELGLSKSATRGGVARNQHLSTRPAKEA